MHPITQTLQIVTATKTDYADLASFCHLSPTLGPVKLLWAIRPKPPYRNLLPRTLAIIVYTPPFPSIKPRTLATAGFFDELWQIKPRMKRINTHIITLARGITHSTYRRLGLMFWLLKTTLDLQPYPIVECLTDIDFKRSHLQRLGFKMLTNPVPPHHLTFQNALRTAHITDALLLSPIAVKNRISALNPTASKSLHNAIKIFVHRFKPHGHNLNQLELTTFWMAKLNYPRAYYVRIDPHSPVAAAISRRNRGDPHHTQPTQTNTNNQKIASNQHTKA